MSKEKYILNINLAVLLTKHNLGNEYAALVGIRQNSKELIHKLPCIFKDP
jgi:hypothetical protein